MVNVLSAGENSIYKNGYGIVAKFVMRDKNLSVEAKAIYAYICSFAGSGTTAFPSAELMISELKMGKNRFFKFRKELVDKGYITIVKQRAGNRRERNLYKIESDIIKKKYFEHPQNEDIEFEDIQNEDIEFEDIQNEDSNNNSINSNSINNNSININNNYKNFKLDGLSNKEVQAIKKYCIENNVDVDVVKEKWKIVKNLKNVKSVVGALITAIKEDWQPAKAMNAESTKSNYTSNNSNRSRKNNFSDKELKEYEELENELLGW